MLPPDGQNVDIDEIRSRLPEADADFLFESLFACVHRSECQIEILALLLDAAKSKVENMSEFINKKRRNTTLLQTAIGQVRLVWWRKEKGKKSLKTIMMII